MTDHTRTIQADDIKFQYELSDWKDFPFIKFVKSRHIDKQKTPQEVLNKQKACERMTDYHDFVPKLLVFTEKPYWPMECYNCNKWGSKINKDTFTSMHEGHDIMRLSDITYTGIICYNNTSTYLYNECGGFKDLHTNIKFCYDCEVIIFYSVDEVCRYCGFHDFYQFNDEYDAWSHNNHVKKMVANKLSNRMEESQ